MNTSRWFKHQNQRDNAIAASKNLLHQLSIPVTDTYMSDFLENHKDYPTLQAISDLLESLRVRNFAAELTVKDLEEIQLPVMSHLKNGQGEFIVMSKLEDSDVTYLDTEKGWIVESLQDFEKKWSGVVLLTQVNENSGEINYKKRRQKERLEGLRVPALVISICILLLPFLVSALQPPTISSPSWIPSFFLKVMGTAVSILLVIRLINRKNPFVNKICNLGLKKNQGNCDIVLDSPASTILGIDWSEIGFLYFTGGLLLFMLSGFTNDQYTVLWMTGILNLLTLPYTFFSIYYQAAIVKRWCTLCVLAQALLWTEFFLAFNYVFAIPPTVTFLSVLNMVCCYLLVFMVWVLVKPSLIRSEQLKGVKKRLGWFENNPEILRFLLYKNKKLDIENKDDIVIGAPEPIQTVVVFISPFCSPCGSAIAFIENYLKLNTQQVQFVIRFSMRKMFSDPQKEDIKFILRTIVGKPEAEVQRSLKAWYTNTKTDFRKWAEKNQLGISRDGEIEKLVNLYEASSEILDIRKTPTIFLNGRELPDGFSIYDIDKFIRASV